MGIEIEHDRQIRANRIWMILFAGNRIRRHKDLVAVFRWRKSHDRRTCQHVWYTIYIYFLLLSVRTMSLNIGLDFSERERKRAIKLLDEWFEWKCKRKVKCKGKAYSHLAALLKSSVNFRTGIKLRKNSWDSALVTDTAVQNYKTDNDNALAP